MKLHLGQTIVRGSLEHYARFFDLLEVPTETQRSLRGAVLRRWRATVPPSFVFSVAVPGAVAAMSCADPNCLDAFWQTVDILEPSWLVIRTPRSVTPTNRHRDNLTALVQRLKTRGGRVAWRAEGLWEADDAQRLASAVDACWIVDIGRDEVPNRASVYASLRSLGTGGVVSSGTVERAAERLLECEDASVVLEGRGAGRAAAQMRQAIGELGAEYSLDLEGDENEAEGTL